MRDYGTVDTGIWRHHDFKRLSESAKLLALYLRTCDHGNMIGCFHLPLMYIAADLGWTTEKALETLSELYPDGFARYCEATEYVLIPKHLSKFPVQGPKQAIGAMRIYEDIPTKFAYLAEITELLLGQQKVSSDQKKQLQNRLERVCKPTRTQDQDQEQYQEQDRSSASAENDDPQIEIDDSVAAATAMFDEMEAKDYIWLYGLHALTKTGGGDSRARAYLGKLCSEYGDAVVARAVKSCYEAKSLDPHGFIRAACQFNTGERKSAKPSAVDLVRQHNAGRAAQ